MKKMEKSENRPRMYQVCPACGIIEPSDEHLMDEYLSLNKARFNDVFDSGLNAPRKRHNRDTEYLWPDSGEIRRGVG